VAEERPLRERVLDEQRGELALDGGVVVVRHVQQLAGLLSHRLDDGGAAVAQAVDGDAGGGAEGPLAGRIPDDPAPGARDGQRLAAVELDLDGRVPRDDLRARHARASRRRLTFDRALRTTSVPTPRLVSTSRSSAWRTRPSITCACLTPPASAAMQHSI